MFLNVEKKIRFHTSDIYSVKLGATKKFCISSDEGKTGRTIYFLIHCYFATVMRRLVEPDQNNAKVLGKVLL